MTPDPIAFVRDELPTLFTRGIALLEERAAADREAKSALEDARGASSTVRVTFEGEPDVFLVLESGAMRSMSAPPAAPPIKLAIALPLDAARRGLEDLGHLLRTEDAAIGVARMASKKTEDALRGESLLFHVLIKGVPDLGDLRVRIGVNTSEAPTTPKFSASLKFDDLERVREGELEPAQLVTGGRIKWSGDYAKAMSMLMQRVPRKR